MSDDGVWLQGRIEDIRRYCETDVMNTYLLYCRFQQMRGGFSDAEYRREVAGVRETLAGLDEPHWREYLGAWAEDAPDAGPLAASLPAAEPASAMASPLVAETVSVTSVSVSVSMLDVTPDPGADAVPQATPTDLPSSRSQR